MSESYRQWEARPKIKAVGMHVDLDDMADGVRSTSGMLLVTQKDVEQGLKALKVGDKLAWVEVQIVNRDYLLEGVTLDSPQPAQDGNYRIDFTAEDLRNITDWCIRGERLASF